MKINFIEKLPEKSDAQLFVATLFEDEKPPRGLSGLLDWHLNGKISRFILEELFSGRFGEKLLFNGPSRLPWERYMLIGMGIYNEVTQENYRKISELIVSSIVDMKYDSVCCQVPGFHRLKFEFSKAFELFLSIFEQHRVTIPDLNIVWIEDLIES
jgi:hypothetical protein